MMNALRLHWPEYLMEAAGLGTFMISACFFATILEYPASPIRQAIPDPLLRRMLIGMANRRQHHLFPLGETIGGTYKPIRYTDVLQTWKS